MHKKNTHAFIVRIWHEAVDGQGKVLTWRGAIEQVGEGRKYYFDSFDQLVRFIQEFSDLKISCSVPRWRSILSRIKRDVGNN